MADVSETKRGILYNHKVGRDHAEWTHTFVSFFFGTSHTFMIQCCIMVTENLSAVYDMVSVTSAMEKASLLLFSRKRHVYN